jgi:hypothetical protein
MGMETGSGAGLWGARGLRLSICQTTLPSTATARLAEPLGAAESSMAGRKVKVSKEPSRS